MNRAPPRPPRSAVRRPVGGRPAPTAAGLLALGFALAAVGAAGVGAGAVAPHYTTDVLTIYQSAHITPQSAFTVYMHVANASNIQRAWFTFCQMTSPVCYQAILMTPENSTWFVGTTKPMTDYPGMKDGTVGGYNITIQYVDNSTFTEPTQPNPFTNLTVAPSVSGSLYFEVTVRNQVFGLRGVVSDQATGHPLAGATVSIVPGNNSTTTGASGAFAFSGLENGSYELTVTAHGYTTRTAPVTVSGQDATQNLALTNATTPSKTSPSPGGGGSGGGSLLAPGPVLYAILAGAVVAAAALGLWAIRRGRGASPPPGPTESSLPMVPKDD